MGVHQISWEEFQEICRSLVEKTLPEHFDIILGIARGGLYPGTLISAMLQKEFYPLRLTRRENDQVKFEKPVWKIDVTDDVFSKRILVVDDISDTGETIRLVVERTLEKGASKVSTLTLVTHSWSSPNPDYFGMESDELIIFPWDTQILVNNTWQLHPELQEALKKQSQT